MSTLDRAIGIAAQAHDGKTDKIGDPYIAHPMRIMARFLVSGREDLAIVGALHDVVEDSTWTLDGLADEGFGPEIIRAVDALTRREGEAYLDYVKRAAAHPLARSVKEADLKDNRDEKRLSWLPEAEQTRLRIKYAKALTALASVKETP